MKQVYPVFLKASGPDILVYVPDLDIYTEGKDEFDAISMARDAIGLKGIEMENDGTPLPLPSSRQEAVEKAKAEADAEFDFSDGLLTLVDVDFTSYRRQLENRSVKKNCTIPYWLNVKAEAMHLNFSKVLQEALLEKVGTSQAG